MQKLLQDPVFQAGVGPLLVALLLAALLRKSRFGWLSIIAAYATLVVLTIGFQFSPLTAGRKLLLLALAAPLVGWLSDYLVKLRRWPLVLSVATAAAAVWVVYSVLAQKPLTIALAYGAGIALFVAVQMSLVQRLRDDPIALTASGLALGLAVGICALLSASTGYFNSGIAMAAGCGALLLVQFLSGAALPASSIGAVTIGVLSSLIACATLMTAQLPWYALPMLLVIPAMAAVPIARRSASRWRIALASILTLSSVALPVGAAWVAARASG